MERENELKYVETGEKQSILGSIPAYISHSYKLTLQKNAKKRHVSQYY